MKQQGMKGNFIPPRSPASPTPFWLHDRFTPSEKEELVRRKSWVQKEDEWTLFSNSQSRKCLNICYVSQPVRPQDFSNSIGCLGPVSRVNAARHPLALAPRVPTGIPLARSWDAASLLGDS